MQRDADVPFLALWRQLLPEGQRVSLWDTGLWELDLTALNLILRRVGWELAFQKAETSPRLVAASSEADEPRDPKTGIPLRFIARFSGAARTAWPSRP